MSMRILVPLDGSPFSEQALPWASEIAQRSRGILHIVRVHTEPALTAPELGYLNLDEQTWASTREYVNAHADQTALEYGVATTPVVLRGSVVSTIANYVAEANIDLVVMTTHGRSGLSRAVLGSVADALLHTLNVPLLLLRPDRAGGRTEIEPFFGRRILIPLDGSELAEQIIEPAVELGWVTGARYTLAHVIVPAVPDTYSTAMATQMREHELDQMREQAANYLEGVANRLRAVGLRVDTAVITNTETAAGIVSGANVMGASIIALASHGRSGWKRLALGSVAAKVLNATPVPMLVMRSSEHALAEAQADTAVTIPALF